jgi:hypothetical protein
MRYIDIYNLRSLVQLGVAPDRMNACEMSDRAYNILFAEQEQARNEPSPGTALVQIAIGLGLNADCRCPTRQGAFSWCGWMVG